MHSPFKSAFRCIAIGGCAIALVTSSIALAAGASPAEDEHTRLMQEYMAKRAEWIALREREGEKIKQAKDEKAKQVILKKLDEDERVLRAAAADLATRLKASAESKKNKGGAPRT